MNALFPPAQAEPRRFSVADILSLVQHGVVDEHARFELLDGEVVPMAPKGPLNEGLREAIGEWLRDLPRSVRALAETTFTLDATSCVGPDYVLYPTSISIRSLEPRDVMLLIEVADSAWTFDTTVKAARYAQAGVQAYWAIDARTGASRVHEGPSGGGWAQVTDIAPGEALVPPAGLGLPTFTPPPQD
jgi:Uma2 family endonuclease